MNGVDLSSLGFNELMYLHASGMDGDELAGLANSRIDPRGDIYDQDQEKVCAYQELRRSGLVDGDDLGNAFLFRSVTFWGRAYARDWLAAEEAKVRARESERRHDLLVAAVGALLGGVLGFFSGSLGSCASACTRPCQQNQAMSSPTIAASPNDSANAIQNTNQS